MAVHQGLADLEMCLPHNLQRLEEDRGHLIQKYELAERELARAYGDEFIVGADRKTLEVLDLIKQVGPTPTTVLIRGESGTGKELTARAIHRYSKRNDKPLVTVNCTTITDSLLESELFGHKKGAFTGAIADKKGLFEAADGGKVMLFLGWGLHVNRAPVDARWNALAINALQQARVNVFTLDITDADWHTLEGHLMNLADLTGGTYAKTNVFSSQALDHAFRAIEGRYVIDNFSLVLKAVFLLTGYVTVLLLEQFGVHFDSVEPHVQWHNKRRRQAQQRE